MSAIHVEPGGTLTIVIRGAFSLKERCPEQYLAILECSGFVNERNLLGGSGPVLAVALQG
jgi:hypothetical protein